MIVLDLSILNQKGTPMFNSDLTANRPAAGIVGRIFIATDAPYGLFRDTGTAWEQVAAGGASVNVYNSDGTLTGNRTITTGGNSLTITGNVPNITTGLFNISSNTSGFLPFIFFSTSATNPAYIRSSNNYFNVIRVSGTNDVSYQSSINQSWSDETGGLKAMIFRSTGNLLIQTGGTYVDAGFKADIQGTLRTTGNVNIDRVRIETNGKFWYNNIWGERWAMILSGDSDMNFTCTKGSQSIIFRGESTYTHIVASSNITSSIFIGRFEGREGFIAAAQNANNGNYTAATARICAGFTAGTTQMATNTQGVPLYISPANGGGSGNKSDIIFQTVDNATYTPNQTHQLTDRWFIKGDSGVFSNTSNPYAPSTFKVDINGGVLIKNSTGTTAQITLINANPALGGNEAFIVHTVGGTSGSSYADLQGYYGTSITGSTALRLNPAGGPVIVNSTTNSGEQFQVTGTLRVNGQRSGSAGGASGQHLIINCDGVSYKIALLNP